MKKIIVINLGWEQEPLLDKLSEYNVEIYGIHYDANYYKRPKYKDVLICDLRDLKKILDFAENIKPDAVISDECDYSHFAQAVISEKFKLKGPTIKNAQISSNKYLQRSLAKEKGIKIPNFKLCSSVDEIKDFIRENSFPCIVKPIDNRGSFGVNKISSEEEIEDAYIDALINASSKLVIVEKYIEGTHVTVDGYIVNNSATSLAVASKTKLEDKNFIIDKEIIYPAEFSSILYEKCMDNASFVANLLGFKFGFFHGEFIIDKNENIYLTEMANRGGGVYTSEIVLPHYTGIDILHHYILDCLDEKTNFSLPLKMHKNPTVMRFFQFSDIKSGVVSNIKGIDEIDTNKNVLMMKLFIKQGDYVGAIKNGADRHGVVIISVKEIDSISAEINNIIQLLKVKTT